MDKNKSIEALQFFVTHLAEGAIVHKQQGMIFKSMGLNKLGQKYIDHFGEEMDWVEKFTERILDLGGELKFEGMEKRDLINDPIEYVKEDLKIQEAGVDMLYKCCEGLINDPTTYDLMKGYLKDEEEDLYWSQGAIEMVNCIGTQNWLLQQL
ncbi:MAG: ferritin-like domain-containing protein [Bacteroidaceae bacterium]|nr:ferritin-like domain-containing protein [Bacteroidaceae bacterium]